MFISVRCKHLYVRVFVFILNICTAVCLYWIHHSLITKSVSLFGVMNPHNVTICMHAFIYPKMPDQTVNSIWLCIHYFKCRCDFRIELWWILSKLRVVSMFELFTNIRICRCLQWITQNICLIYRYFELYDGKLFTY